MSQLNTFEEGQRLAQALRDGKVPEEKIGEAKAALRDLRDRLEAEKQQTAQDDFSAQIEQMASSYMTPEMQAQMEAYEKLTPTQQAQARLLANDSAGNRMKATADLALTFGTGALANIVGGVAMAGELVNDVTQLDRLQGRESTYETRAKALEDIQDAMTWQPRSQAGRDILQIVAPAMMTTINGARDINEKLSGSSPMAATIAETTILGAMDVAGMKATKPTSALRQTAAERAAVRKLAKQLKEMGIDPNAKKLEATVLEAAKKIAPAKRGQFMEEAMAAARRAQHRQRNLKDIAYNEAKKSRTFVETQDTKALHETIMRDLDEQLIDFEADGMGGVIRALDELNNLDTRIPGARQPVRGQVYVTTNLANVERIRRRLSRLSNTPGEVGFAAGRSKKAIDAFMETELAKVQQTAGRIPRGQSAISGDAAGVARWKKARAQAQKYYELFTDDQIMKAMVDKNATPEDVAAQLFGASALGQKKRATEIVRRIQQVDGPTSDAMNALKAEATYALLTPLLKEKPNYTQFAQNYKLFLKNNPTLARQLDLDAPDMLALSDAALAAANLPPQGRLNAFKDLFARGAATQTVGSDLAKKGFRVALVRNLIGALVGVRTVPKNQALRQMAGFDPRAPLISRGSQLATEAALGATPSEVMREDTWERIARFNGPL